MIKSQNNSTVYTSSFTSWQESVSRLLDAAGLYKRLTAEKKIIIKPNLVGLYNPPITTPVELVAAIADYIHASCPDLEIIIGEGCGSSSNNTWQVFEALGYTRLADLDRVTLVDLNEAPLVHMKNNKCKRWPEMHLQKSFLKVFSFQSRC